MPRGIARDPSTDGRRRKPGAGGRPRTLEPGSTTRSYRATPAQHTLLRAYLAQLRANAAVADKQGQQEGEEKT